MGLFKSIWMRDDLIKNGNLKKFDKAYEVVSNMTDQDELRRVVLEATHETLALKAIGRIDDEAFFSRIALGHVETRTKGAFFSATRKVHDQDVLGQIALSGAENAAIAVENVASQAMLARIARTSQSDEARLEAMKRIDDPAEIVSIAAESGDPDLAAQARNLVYKAIARCDDAQRLEDLALDVNAPEFAYVPEWGSSAPRSWGASTWRFALRWTRAAARPPRAKQPPRSRTTTYCSASRGTRRRRRPGTRRCATSAAPGVTATATTARRSRSSTSRRRCPIRITAGRPPVT